VRDAGCVFEPVGCVVSGICKKYKDTVAERDATIAGNVATIAELEARGRTHKLMLVQCSNGYCVICAPQCCLASLTTSSPSLAAPAAPAGGDDIGAAAELATLQTKMASMVGELSLAPHFQGQDVGVVAVGVLLEMLTPRHTRHSVGRPCGGGRLLLTG